MCTKENFKMQAIRAIIVAFVALAAPAIICAILWGVIMGGGAVKDFYNNTVGGIIKEYGLFGSSPIHIKDDERRERIMAEQRKEYEEILARSGKSPATVKPEEEAETVSTEELTGAPEIAKTVKEWSVQQAKNPPMSPVAQATAFLSSMKSTVNDGVKHNELTEQDIAVITKALLSSDIEKLAELDKIYGRKNLVIENAEGVTKRLYERPNGKLAVLTLSKKLSEELEAEKAK